MSDRGLVPHRTMCEGRRCHRPNGGYNEHSGRNRGVRLLDRASSRTTMDERSGRKDHQWPAALQRREQEMGLDRAVNVDDLRRLAKKRLPKIAFDFIEGGCDDEDGLTRNERSFRDRALVPRYMVDVSKRDPTKTLYRCTYARPFAISPTVLAALFRPGGA